MSTSTEQQGSHMMRSAVLVSLESFLSLLLKTDKRAQRAAKRLIASNALVEFQTYMPSERFYATFSNKGILIDGQKPQERSVNLTVLASTPDLLRAFLTGSAPSLARIQIDGDPVLLADLRLLMKEFTLVKLTTNWFQWGWMLVKRASHEEEDEDRAPRATNRTVRPLLRKIDLQQSQMDRMNLAIKERMFEVADVKKQLKRTRQIAAGIIAVLAIWILVLYYLMYR